MQALSHLLRCPPEDCSDGIELAIETVASADDSSLVNDLIDYLHGDRDGNVKVYTTVTAALTHSLNNTNFCF